MSSRISLLLADSHTLVRETMAHWLQSSREFAVVASVASADEDFIVHAEEKRYCEWCDLEWYYGSSLQQIREEVQRIRATDIARVVDKFLSSKNAITVTIAPQATK